MESPQTGDWTRALCMVGSHPLYHQGSPHCGFSVQFCDDYWNWVHFAVSIGHFSTSLCSQEAFLFFYCRVLFLFVCVLVTQSCQTLCDPKDCSLPGFSVRGILQARILAWIAIPFLTCSKSVYILDSGPLLLTYVYCRSSCILWLALILWIVPFGNKRVFIRLFLFVSWVVES